MNDPKNDFSAQDTVFGVSQGAFYQDKGVKIALINAIIAEDA